ncbi:acyltransferase family protein [Longimicrobium sp.]|uniref:acyltransferase family protein n=1 Tax=Longimicrobium sp. TaxID=2029185 RepID=UPI003B3A8EB1
MPRVPPVRPGAAPQTPLPAGPAPAVAGTEAVPRAMGKGPTHAAAGGFRPDIEGLRGVAILLVIAYHAGIPAAAGGYVGVDVFFVLSGYLITGLLLAEAERTDRVNLVQFYARRARRLLPASALVVLVTLLLGALVYSPMEQRSLATTAAATSLYASNLWFAFLSTDYLGSHGAPSPLLHTWSLAVEEQFYLFWPVLAALVLRGARETPRRARLLALTVVLGAASFAAVFWLSRFAQSWAFFGSPTRAWEFALGALGLLLAGAWSRLPARATRALAWAGFAAVLGAGVAFGPTTRHPGFISLIPVVGTVLVLMAGARDPSAGVGRVLGVGWLQWVGRVSYSWYLWHWPLLVLAAVAFPRGGAPLRLLCVALSLGLAAVTLRLVENPIRHSRALAPRPVLTLAGAAGLTLVAAALAVGGRQLALRLQEHPSQARFTRASTDQPQVPPECHLPFFGTEAGECVFGDPAGRVTVALFGDSHALSWFPAMERMARENGWKLVSLTKAGCAAASVRPAGQLGGVERACIEWRQAVVARLAALRPDAVVMTSSTNYIDAADGGTTHTRIRAAEWEAGTRRTLAAFQAAQVPVVLLRDTPWPDAHVPHCLARSAWTSWWRGARSCTFAQTNPLSELAERLERRAAAGVPGVRYVEMTDPICRASPCRPERDGMVLYNDSHHLTATFSASLAPALEREILPLLPPGAAQVPPAAPVP